MDNRGGGGGQGEQAPYIGNPKRYLGYYAGVHQLQQKPQGLFGPPQEHPSGMQRRDLQEETQQRAEE